MAAERESTETKDPRVIKPSSSLAFKFAWRVSVVIAVLVLLFGIVASLTLKNLATEMINARGVDLATAEAAHGLEYWRQFTHATINPLMQTLENNDDVVNIVVFEPDATGELQVQAAARPFRSAEVKENTNSQAQIPNRPDTTITTGTFEKAGETLVNVRIYRKPVAAKDGKEGTLLLVLSARRVEEQRWSFLSTLVIVGLVAVGLGIGTSFLLAALVARPARSLATDMGAVSRGNLEHKTRVHGNDEIGMLGRSFNRMIVSLQEAQTREVERRAIERELSIAQEIQSSLLPAELPKLSRFDLFPYYEPAKEVGGDYYDFIPVDRKHLGLVVADVSGKGIPGCMVMTMVRSIIRYESRGLLSAGETLKRVNRLVASDIKRGMFVTAIYMIIDITTGETTMASAGHNPLIYWSGKEQTCRLINPGGMALGLDRGLAFNEAMREVTLQLATGDRLVAYSDGIVEAMNEQDEEYGDDRFLAACQRLAALPSEEFVTGVVEEVRMHQGGAEQHDDITLSTLRFLGESREE